MVDSHNTYAIADPAFDRNWWQGMGDAAVLAAVGANWLAAGTTWVSLAGQQLVWQSGRWWNRTANRAATAEEAAAATQAVAAARAAAAPIGEGISNWLGPGARVVRDDAGGFVILSRDGLRRFRMDFAGPGTPPAHAHLEVWNPVSRRWVDAIPGQHRIPFRGD